MTYRIVTTTAAHYGPARPQRVARYASPIMRRVCEAIDANIGQRRIADVCQRAGVTRAPLYRWRDGGDATISNVAAVLEELGLELVVRERQS